MGFGLGQVSVFLICFRYMFLFLLFSNDARARHRAMSTMNGSPGGVQCYFELSPAVRDERRLFQVNAALSA
jgi:hypothetical protein